MHTESQIAIPAIEVMIARGGICDTSDLIADLKSTLPLDDEDLEILPSGLFPRIDQIIRNLKSNKHLLKMGLVEHYDGGFILTNMASSYTKEELEEIKEQHFNPTNELSLQQAMVTYVKDNGLSFVDSMKAANAIRATFIGLPEFKSDAERIKAVGTLVDAYVSTNPTSLK
jgi:hypothetical protein